MKSSQSYAATLTHYSTDPLTTGPDYDPLLLLLALGGDVHPNTGPPRYPYSVCFKNVTSPCTSYMCTRCSHSRCSGIRNVADSRRTHGWICIPPVGRHHIHAHLPHRPVPHIRPRCGTPMVSETNKRN